MATGDKLVNLDELKLVYDKLHVPSVQVQIPTGQWSGSSTRTYTVNATNVTADTIIDWAMDSSINYLTSDLTVTPGSGTIQFSTTAIPSGTINVTLFFPGVKGDVVIQTLADVYSKSQTYSKSEAVAKADIVNNLTSPATDKPLSANMGRELNSKIEEITKNALDQTGISLSYNVEYTAETDGYVRVIAPASGPMAVTVNGLYIIQGNDGITNSLYIRKGTKLKVVTNSGGSALFFKFQ